jgi:hypothetical protein
MATYNGFFVRSALNQSNITPRAGAQSNSPDIIPYGITPVSNPQVFFKDNYNQDVGQRLEAEKTNYIYLRAKNYSSSRIVDKDDTRPRLFWTRASVLSYPDKWTELTKTGSRNPVSMEADPGQVGVISEPLIWQPDNITADHYCMIAQVPSPGYDNSIPNTLQISDFAGWVAKSGGIAWRNVTVLNSDTLTLTAAKLYYEQGIEASTIQFTIKCLNVPVGSTISFSAGVGGPNPPIYLAPTVVSTGPSFTTGVECDVPANYVSDIYVNVSAPKGVTNLNNAKVTIQAAYPTSFESHLYAYGKTNAELGIPNPDEAYAMIMREISRTKGGQMEQHHEQYLDQLSDLHRPNTLDLPQRLIVVGQNNYDWKNK